jgi:hypothetical protein
MKLNLSFTLRKLQKNWKFLPLFQKKRVRKRNIHHPGEENSVLSAEDYFRIQLKETVDCLIANLSLRSEVLQETSLNFEFLSGPAFISMKSNEFERVTYNLAVKYKKDLDASEFCLDTESFKHQAQTLLPCVESATPLGPCQLIQDYTLLGCYLNIEIALHIFLTLPVTVVSCERSFNKLKIIKN